MLEIEQHPEPAESLPELATEDEFNSDTFIDDLLNSAPAKDPLLEPVLDENEAFAQADDFDFNPEIEGGLEDDLPQPSALPANEFGTPQDEDWVFDEDDSSPTLEGNTELELSSAEDDLPEQTTATNETVDELLTDLAAQPQSNTVDTSDDALALTRFLSLSRSLSLLTIWSCQKRMMSLNWLKSLRLLHSTNNKLRPKLSLSRSRWLQKHLMMKVTLLSLMNSICPSTLKKMPWQMRS